MTAALAAVLTVLVVGLLLGALALLLGVLPFVVGVDMAERRGFSTARWGGLCVGSVLLAALVGYAALKGPRPAVLLVPLLAWSVPAVLRLLDPARVPLAGSQGAHER
ncbi:MAG: hypothetical protein WCD35_05585 [Mycobacteriales bacterium]